MTTIGVNRFPRQAASGTIHAVHLHDVIDQNELTAALNDWYVREQNHRRVGR